MDGFEFIDFVELDNNIDFSKFIIEFFKNDYLMIVDFLVRQSPWDNNIMYNLKISKDELDELKRNMVKSIVEVYEAAIITPLQLQGEEEVEPNPVDVPYINLIKNGTDPVTAFFINEFCSIQMLRHYIEVIQYKYDIKIDTYNKYRYDILELINVHQELCNRIGLDTRKYIEIDKELEKKYLLFFYYLFLNVKEYVQQYFRNDKERESFVNYLYSITYAYIKQLQLYDDELTEEEKAILVDINSDEGLLEKFLSAGSMSCYIVESLVQNYEDNKLGYDFRRAVADKDAQELFSKLDENYEIEFKDDFIISNLGLDDKLTKVLDNLINNLSIPELYNVLLENITIYTQLYDVGLDARKSDYYKELIIRKILVDVYEYEIYQKSIDSEYKPVHHEEIKNLPGDYISIKQYFIHNGFSLIELYTDYHCKGMCCREKARIKVYENKELAIINKISNFSMFNYMLIMNGTLRPLESVDYMNKLLAKVTEFVKSGGELGTLIDVPEERDKFIKTICLNVYEHLITDETINDDEELQELIYLLEYSNVSYSALMNPMFLIRVCNLFVAYNKEPLSYSEEIKKRKKISDQKHVRVLKKLNPFDES